MSTISSKAVVKIRIADDYDADLLAALGERTFRETFESVNTPEDMASYLASSFSHAIQAGELAKAGSTFLIAEVDKEPAGYARLQGGNMETCITGARPVELVRIYALAKWLGKGVGSALMQACLDTAAQQGYDVIWLGVWERNPRAIAFYQKWGFKQVGYHIFQLGADAQQDLILQLEMG